MITAFMSRSWKVEVCQKKKKNTTGRRDDQSAISSKEHVKYEATQTYCCQLRTNTTACTRSANDYGNGVRDHGNNKARHPPNSLLGRKKHQTRTMRYGTNACHSLVYSVDAVDFYYDLRVAQLNNRRNDYFPPYFIYLFIYFFPYFLCRKCMLHPRSMP